MKTVFFLVMMGWNSGGSLATSGAVVLPTPYNTIEECRTAAAATRRADKDERADRLVWMYCVPAQQ